MHSYSATFIRHHRSLIALRGQDRFDFLQGLTTQDVHPLKTVEGAGCESKPLPALYTLFVNAQGRYLFDAFLLHHQDTIWISTDHRGKDLLSHLLKYKLRRDVTLSLDESAIMYTHVGTLPVAEGASALTFQDPRCDVHDPNPWYHTIAWEDLYPNASTDESLYHALRIEKGCPENNAQITNEGEIFFPHGYDWVEGRTFPQEARADTLNALNFKKGCYLGQEPIARTHYQGVVRKKLYPLKATHITHINPMPHVGEELYQHDAVVGEVRSWSLHDNTLWIMAMVRGDDHQGIHLRDISLLCA